MRIQGLRLHLETELRGQAEVLAENTERNETGHRQTHIAETVWEIITCVFVFVFLAGSIGALALLELPL